MSEDVTIAELLAYFAPDAVHIYWPDGTEVTSGHLATGMTVETYTLVVLGDCDGSGMVSQQDMRHAQELLLANVKSEDPYRRAADLDGDGSLTTMDTVFLSQLLVS